jgi:hypothetical protein
MALNLAASAQGAETMCLVAGIGLLPRRADLLAGRLPPRVEAAPVERPGRRQRALMNRQLGGRRSDLTGRGPGHLELLEDRRQDLVERPVLGHQLGAGARIGQPLDLGLGIALRAPGVQDRIDQGLGEARTPGLDPALGLGKRLRPFERPGVAVGQLAALVPAVAGALRLGTAIAFAVAGAEAVAAVAETGEGLCETGLARCSYKLLQAFS